MAHMLLCLPLKKSEIQNNKNEDRDKAVPILTIHPHHRCSIVTSDVKDVRYGQGHKPVP